MRVLEDSIPDIDAKAAEVAELFDVPGFDATIAVGNRASSDGFGWRPDFIGINTEAFVEAYGPPGEGAADRMTRIVAHEYLHLLTYANYPDDRDRRTTPTDRALWTIFFEGIGDYVSMSSRWLPDAEGAYSRVAMNTLAELEPVFIDRLRQLMSDDESREAELRRGLATGRFDRKWGSLSFALWLRNEARRCGERETLRAVFRLERASVFPLAIRHINPAYRDQLADLHDSKLRQDPGFEDVDQCLWMAERTRPIGKRSSLGQSRAI